MYNIVEYGRERGGTISSTPNDIGSRTGGTTFLPECLLGTQTSFSTRSFVAVQADTKYVGNSYTINYTYELIEFKIWFVSQTEKYLEYSKPLYFDNITYRFISTCQSLLGLSVATYPLVQPAQKLPRDRQTERGMTRGQW